MLRYPTPSDQRYADACNAAMPQGGTHWVPGRPDTYQPAVTRDLDHGAPRLRSNQMSSNNNTNNYPSVTPNNVPPSADSYPNQPSADFTAPQRAYPPHQYASSVNYAAPPYDFAAYPIVSDSVYQGGQYGTQPSHPTRCDYPTSDATSFHSSLYGPMGYFGPDGQRNSPPGAQHQPSLISGVRFDDMFGDYYEQFPQHPMPSIPPSSSSSELGNALMEITSPEPSQPISRSSIALPTLPTPSHSAVKCEPSEAVGVLNPVKNEFGATVNGQAFSPMMPLDNSLLVGGQPPYPKEESREPSMPRPPTPLHVHDPPRHRQQSQDSFRMVQDPAAFPEFAPAPKRHPPSLSIPPPLSYSPSARIPTPLSSSFSSSDAGTPTSAMHLLDSAPSSSSVPQSTMVPNPTKAGQGVLKLPSTKRSARRKPAIACLFCRERKIACGAPPVGSADTTCNQCARRSRKCEYPTMSRRGLHKRRDNGGGHQRESEDADYVPTT